MNEDITKAEYNDRTDSATCELGFWKPMHEGCPVCGPNGPCPDEEYERMIQWHKLPWWKRLFTKQPVG